jgi:hypothetical protein
VFVVVLTSNEPTQEQPMDRNTFSVTVKKIVTVVAAVVLSATAANAQIIQAVTPFANSGEPESKKTRQADQAATGATLLSQASVEAIGSDSSQIGLQAMDLWINRYTRLYARLTLPVKAQAATMTTATTATANSAIAAPATKPSEGIVKQLVDPYGGLFNLSGGVFKAVYTPTSEAKAMNAQPDHGAFLDVRGGFKLLDLPNAAGSAPSVGNTKVGVFYTGIAGVKYIANLYDWPTAMTTDHLAGGLTLGAYVVGNYAADTSQSDVFDTALRRGTVALTAIVGVNLPSVAGITFSFTPWTNDEARLGKTFVFGFTLLRPTKETPKKSGAQANEPEQDNKSNVPNDPTPVNLR